MITIVAVLGTGIDRAMGCLSALSQLDDDPSHRVVIIDNGSVDLEPLLAQVEGDVIVRRHDSVVSLATAINDTLGQIPEGIVALLCDMDVVKQGWLKGLVTALADPAVAAATSNVDGADTPSVIAPAVAWRRADLARIPEVPDHHVVAAIIAEVAGVGAVVCANESVVEARATTRWGEHLFGAPPEVSIVIPTLDATDPRVRACISALQACTPVPHEIIVVDNGAPPQGFTAPVNQGIRAARGRYIVVCNDDVEVLPGWWDPLAARLDEGAKVVFPHTVEGPTRYDFAAWCFAMTADTVDEFSVASGAFLDPQMVIWFQDTDLRERLRNAGHPPVYVPESHIRHGLSVTVDSDDPTLRAWVKRQVQRDRVVFEGRHPGVAPLQD